MNPRLMRITFVAEETAVGGVLADLGERAQSVAFEVVEVVDGRSRKRPRTLTKKAKPGKRKRVNGEFLKALSAAQFPSALSRQFDLTPGAVYQRLSGLKEKKLAKKLSDGRWVATSKGAKA